MRIFLIGFMGTGKSRWGEIWASQHDLNFIDLDIEIEKKTGLSIEEIFEKKGEDFFRDVEANTLMEMEQYDNCIIACGGGTPCFKNNMVLIFLTGFEYVLLKNNIDISIHLK